MFQFNRIETSLLNLLVNGRVTLIESYDERWNDAEVVECSDLLGCSGTTVQDISVDLAIRFL